MVGVPGVVVVVVAGVVVVVVAGVVVVVVEGTVVVVVVVGGAVVLVVEGLLTPAARAAVVGRAPTTATANSVARRKRRVVVNCLPFPSRDRHFVAHGACDVGEHEINWRPASQ